MSFKVVVELKRKDVFYLQNTFLKLYNGYVLFNKPNNGL